MRDDALTDRLSDALETRANPPVDVESLLSGSHRRARQVRNRRIGLGTASLVVLVIALPVGIDTLRGSDDPELSATISSEVSDRPAAMMSTQALPSPRTGLGPAASATGPTGAGIEPGSAVSTQPPSVVPSLPGFSAAIPDSIGFDLGDLPDGMHLLADPGQSAATFPLVSGQTCRQPRSGDLAPVAGRQWIWTDQPGTATSATRTGASVSLTVTGWAAGIGRPAFDELVSNTGRCRFLDEQEVDTVGIPGLEAWMATSTIGDQYYGRAVVRLGDLMAGIEVQDEAGGTSAQTAARRLADQVGKQLATAGFVAPTPRPSATSS